MLFRRLNNYIHFIYDADHLNDLNNTEKATVRAIRRPHDLHGIPVKRQKWNTSDIFIRARQEATGSKIVRTVKLNSLA